MKYLVVLFVVLYVNSVLSKVLPDHLPEPCGKSEEDLELCVTKAIRKAGPYLLKGIPEIGLPGLDPLQIPVMTVDRTLNELVSISAVMKDVKVVGLGKTILNSLKIDPEALTADLQVTMPHLQLSMDYSVIGRVLSLPLLSRGYFRGNFSNTVTTFKISVKPVEREGVTYLTTDRFIVKSRVDDGYVKIKAKDADNQLATDLISEFYNQNSRLFMDAINPIYVEHAAQFYRSLVEKILETVPAKELLPQ